MAVIPFPSRSDPAPAPARAAARWELRSADTAVVEMLAREASLPPALARLLVLRGIRTPDEVRRYLQPALSDLHSPLLMLGMQAAVARLAAAVGRQERVLIYGDYDVDGTVAVVVLKTAIELCGGKADFHVPHRITEGYGLRDEVLERAKADGVSLVISVDTGIRAFAAADTAARIGLDLIVTDHHLPEAQQGVPRAVAVLNPNQAACAYPCKQLCGAGVALKLAQALLSSIKGEPECMRLLPSFLKMVAIATIADSVPLVDENRVITKLGVEGLRKPFNPGLKALLQVAGIEKGRLPRGSDIGFRIAPRINAAGRMDVAREVVEMFTCGDAAHAGELASKLNLLNAERQEEEARILAAIHQRLDGDPSLAEAFCVVVDGDGWHRGVIGIAATRVVDRTGRPALVLSVEGEEAHGSGRSIASFHLLEALESCRELFTRFGGHAHAVGFAMPSRSVPELRQRLDKFARSRLTLADFEPRLAIDAEVRLEELDAELYSHLQQLEPFGMGNREPVFSAPAVRVLTPPKIMKEKHFKVRVSQPRGDGSNGKAIDVLAWRMAGQLAENGAGAILAGDMLDIAFNLEQNTHPDFGGALQLCLHAFRRHAASAAALP